MRGDYQRAEDFSKECLQLCLDLGDKLVAAEALEALACSFGARGETERVPKLFGAARTLREEVGYRHDSREHALREPYLSSARSQLTAEAWERACKEGQAMTLEVSVSYALEENGNR